MGNLPVIIIPAICAEKNNPFGDSVTCSRNGMSYVSLSMSVIRNYFSALSKMLCYEHYMLGDCMLLSVTWYFHIFANCPFFI